MKIVIPMSGRGNRFVQAGYTDPKPLIEVDGMPIIEHVVNMFPGETNFIFICSNDHLETTNMRSILNRIAPKGEVIGIEPHKLGPVFAVSQIFSYLSDEEEVIVNYCDFSCYWDYTDFLFHTRERNADGAIPAYKGFHPHMLGSTNYAFMRDENQWMLEIKEKEPFTLNRMEEYASSGTYYFKKGSYVKKYFVELMEKELHLNGEYYVSLIYNLLQKDGLKTSIYEIQHMLQWGTPQDLAEYTEWSHYFNQVIEMKLPNSSRQNSTNLIPLAGAGKRFVQEGYTTPKPLIHISGKPMIIQATSYIPKAEQNVFICQLEHLTNYNLEQTLTNDFPNAQIIQIDKLTEGQAKTCELGLPVINPENELFISACDNGVLWDFEKYESLLNDDSIDVIVWGFKNHPSSKLNPQMYGWIDASDTGIVRNISVKVPISDYSYNDYAIVGSFFFRKAKHFARSIEQLFNKDIRVNGEFYVDSAINEAIEQGLKVVVFEVESYICWGTPNDLRTFEYWQSFFHKWPWHKYSITVDPFIHEQNAKELKDKFTAFRQSNL
jgi:NDP-sugar pyrophosphorylase family protein